MYQPVEEKENKRAGIIAAMIFLICLFMFFFMVSLRVPDPPKEPEPPLELVVNLSGGSSGGSSPTSAEQTTDEEEVSDKEIESTPADAIETQPDESTPQTSSEEDTDEESDQTEEQQTVNSDALFQGMSGDNGEGGEGTGQGENTGSGTDDGQGEGTGGSDGNYTLTGRSLKAKPSSDIDTDEEGTVVLNIWVNQDGSVARATYNRSKSSIQDQRLIDYCIRQAQQELKFNAKPGAAIEQKGTYTFRFEIK